MLEHTWTRVHALLTLCDIRTSSGPSVRFQARSLSLLFPCAHSCTLLLPVTPLPAKRLYAVARLCIMRVFLVCTFHVQSLYMLFCVIWIIYTRINKSITRKVKRLKIKTRHTIEDTDITYIMLSIHHAWSHVHPSPIPTIPTPLGCWSRALHSRSPPEVFITTNGPTEKRLI